MITEASQWNKNKCKGSQFKVTQFRVETIYLYFVPCGAEADVVFAEAGTGKIGTVVEGKSYLCAAKKLVSDTMGNHEYTAQNQ